MILLTSHHANNERLPVARRRAESVAVWSAGVAAVDSARLVRQVIARVGDQLQLGPERISRTGLGRLLVLGGGKAGAGMARGFVAAIEADWGPRFCEQQVSGWLNVPADCVAEVPGIRLHAGRPAGLNEPTAEGVAGVAAMLALARSMTADDVALVLLSGGGSALLPAPRPPITLAEKQFVTRLLMHRGAPIEDLNLVRACLSEVKGGGLLRAMPAGRCVTLVISDVIGDPLDVIASGPTWNRPLDWLRARAILEARAAKRDEIPRAVWNCLDQGQKAASQAAAMGPTEPQPLAATVPVSHLVIGNNRTAVEAAAREAERRGYPLILMETDQRGEARTVGSRLMQTAIDWWRQHPGERGAIVSGGEPVVTLAETDQPRQGGRNQELAVAALRVLASVATAPEQGGLTSADSATMDTVPPITLISGGSDGEDGPTDAAGGIADERTLRGVQRQLSAIDDALAINNTYPLLAAAEGLLKTGPTHTNVMDLRVLLIG